MDTKSQFCAFDKRHKSWLIRNYYVNAYVNNLVTGFIFQFSLFGCPAIRNKSTRYPIRFSSSTYCYVNSRSYLYRFYGCCSSLRVYLVRFLSDARWRGKRWNIFTSRDTISSYPLLLPFLFSLRILWDYRWLMKYRERNIFSRVETAIFRFSWTNIITQM